MKELITIGNKSQEIVATNYWGSRYNSQGVLYFSVNAGAFRLLVPDGIILDVEEMKTAKNIIVSTGPGMNRHCVFEILFDDETDNPYVLHFGTEQADSIPNVTFSKGEVRFIVYKRNLIVAIDTVCNYRQVSRIPCMKPLK